ncbi:hypothetical protein DPX16_9007 [Anabarilius grahami]|uniref:Uncharacterized protein n=1 Tax=Anabarilius grahami TaxID=495550 RepID=A0A3N0YHB7_ANAGA|nr:hypothetical protein DPX16_9007 [Anabarilius grahami]
MSESPECWYLQLHGNCWTEVIDVKLEDASEEVSSLLVTLIQSKTLPPDELLMSPSEPGADLKLIDLWSMDPIPTQFPTLKSSSSLSPSLSLCGSSFSPWASPNPRLHLGLSARHHRLGSPLLHRLIGPETQLGSLVTPGRSPAVETQLLPWIFLGFWLHLHPAPLWRHRVPSFLQPPHRPCSLHRRPGHPSPRLRLSPASQQLSIRLPGLRCSAGPYTHHGSASADRSQGSIHPLSQDCALDPPMFGATMAPLANSSRLLSVTSSTPFIEASTLFRHPELS